MIAATLLALGAAVLHATWNLVLKRSHDRDGAFWAIVGIGGLVSIPVLAGVGLPGPGAVPFLVASALVQVLYMTALARAYTHGDFSLAYPLARGTGALLAAVGGAIILDDQLPGPAWLGVAVVAVSLLLLTRRGATVVSFSWAAGTGLAIAAYSVIDTAGSRHAASGISYGLTLQVATAITVSVAGLARRKGGAMLAEVRRAPWQLVGAGVLITASYTMVVSAFRLAPVGYVSVLRESSVLLGAALGWLVLRERFGRQRLMSAAVMVAGLALLIAAA